MRELLKFILFIYFFFWLTNFYQALKGFVVFSPVTTLFLTYSLVFYIYMGSKLGSVFYAYMSLRLQ